ncbi:MAG: hypothetical protein LKI77_02065 [Bifidobacterium sp.]|jgi:septal ring factor EnvC (AmiA/AmiB activator)|nr:hypothetical protein [Bifidobacterium sp.]
MDTRERWQAEEEHDEHIRQLNQAEELLNDYRQQAYHYTDRLVDYVQAFYHNTPYELPYQVTNSLSDRFQQTFEEYNRSIRQQAEQLDEARDQEQRDYARKLEE